VHRDINSRVMIEIDLEVLWLTDEQQELENASVSVPIEDCITKTHTFYQISFIRKRTEKNLCEVGSNGEDFIINEPYESVKQKIKDQIIFKWN